MNLRLTILLFALLATGTNFCAADMPPPAPAKNASNKWSADLPEPNCAGKNPPAAVLSGTTVARPKKTAAVISGTRVKLKP